MMPSSVDAAEWNRRPAKRLASRSAYIAAASKRSARRSPLSVSVISNLSGAGHHAHVATEVEEGVGHQGAGGPTAEAVTDGPCASLVGPSMMGGGGAGWWHDERGRRDALGERR